MSPTRLEANEMLYRLMVEAEEADECWCGKRKAHAGWLNCLSEEGRKLADHDPQEEADDGG